MACIGARVSRARRATVGQCKLAGLRFRQYRRSLIHNAASNENHLEMNEGLAEYTGIRLSNTNEGDRRAAAISRLHNAHAKG